MERILRARILDEGDSLDSGHSPPPEPTPTMVGRVYDGGSMPASLDHYFLVHPVEVDGDAAEGVAGTPVVDTSSSVAVDVIGTRVPAVGDMLECFHIGGRWVAESRGHACHITVVVECGTDAVPEVEGAVVTVIDPDNGDLIATGTTNAAGRVDLDVFLPGDYKLKIATSGRPTTNLTKTIACGDLMNIDLCGTPCEVCVVGASSLTLTLSTTTGDPLVLPMTFSAFGGGSWTAFGPGSQTFSLSCTDPQGWRLSCSYFDTTISGGVTCFLNLGGDCDGPDFTVLDLGGCTNITSSTGYKLPITITL